MINSIYCTDNFFINCTNLNLNLTRTTKTRIDLPMKLSFAEITFYEIESINYKITLPEANSLQIKFSVK